MPTKLMYHMIRKSSFDKAEPWGPMIKVRHLRRETCIGSIITKTPKGDTPFSKTFLDGTTDKVKAKFFKLLEIPKGTWTKS